MFKWHNYAKNRHLVGFFMHIANAFILTLFTYCIYIIDVEAGQTDQPVRRFLEFMLILGVIYPGCYEFCQVSKMGIR